MIPTFILLLSFAALAQFFVSFCHTLIRKSQDYQLSEYAREMAGISAPFVAREAFERLMQLIALCPEYDEQDVHRIRTVSAYFSLLGWLQRGFAELQPRAAAWVASEQNGCAQFAAMILDRRIAYSRSLLAEQINQHF